ncbi:methyltransferase domain-containing protein [Nitriliruptoria bacterium AS10]|nr:methyltransferase domain-containing protein [Salsipaludibacter albus]MBY5163322.1 methyltransferase domain-containing protein [Salsipaludibacter albus]
MTDGSGPDDEPTETTSPRDDPGGSPAGVGRDPGGDPSSGLDGPLGALADAPPGQRDGGASGDGGTPDVTAAAAAVLRDRATEWFEPLYRDAAGDPSAVPWAGLAPHPHVVGWLDQPGLDVTGVDAVVVGCGLGDDAVELARRGCRVTAFDVSPTAVTWARERFARDLAGMPGTVDWQVADLLDLPAHLVGAFGLVVEVRTVQSLPATVRDRAMVGVSSLAGPGGWVLVSTLLATSEEAARSWQGPPWAQAPSELAAYRVGGLERVALEHPPADPSRPAMEVRLTLHRAGSASDVDSDVDAAGRAVPE